MILRMVVSLFTLICLLSPFMRAKKFDTSKERQWEEFQEFLRWKASKGLNNVVPADRHSAIFGDSSVSSVQEQQRDNDKRKFRFENHQDPPPVDDAALMGRYIVNQADWASVATISTRKDIETFPFVNLVSYSDGPLGNGSGIPYLYLTPLDATAQDLSKDHRATLMMTFAQGDYCKEKMWDPMDPRCAKILLSGKIKALKNGSAELEVARNAVFGRHPKLIDMPADHHFFFAKLKIASIAVLDTFGGPKYVTVKDYLHPPTANITEEFHRRFPAKIVMSESSLHDDLHAATNSFYPIVINV